MNPFEAAKMQQETIAAARNILKPSKVSLDHVPLWMRRRLKRVIPDLTAIDALYYASTRRILDHWGSTMWHDKECFVTEPYQFCLADVQQFRGFLGDGVDWRHSVNSWHYPGSTHRILFFETDSDISPITMETYF
jgi:hypothetical protein